MPAVAVNDLAHLIADIRSQLEEVGLGCYRERLRLTSATREELAMIQHAVMGARLVVRKHIERMTVRERLEFRDLEITLDSLNDNVLEARRRLG